MKLPEVAPNNPNNLLKLIEGSIQLWEEVAAGQRLNNGSTFSNGRAIDPLCATFRPHKEVTRMGRTGLLFGTCSDQCPVKAKTGQDACAGTPMDDYLIERQRKEYDYTSNRRSKARAATVVTWLKQLRDEVAANS